MKTAFPMAFSASLFLVPVLGHTNDTNEETLTESSHSQLVSASTFVDVVCDRYEPCDCSSGLRRLTDELTAYNECNAPMACTDAAS